MQLFRTTCSTDWKGRPNHFLLLVAESDDRAVLEKAMDEDVQKWQVDDIIREEELLVEEEGEGDIPDDWEDKRREELLAKSWGFVERLWYEQNRRWEMQNINASDGTLRMAREFVENSGDGDISTVVYHFFEGPTHDQK